MKSDTVRKYCDSTDKVDNMININNFNSSITKVIDNAIIGYVESNLKPS